jgi:hypothetical protein
MNVCSSTVLTPDFPFNIDCTQSLLATQRLYTIFMMTSEIAEFWDVVRLELQRNYGQDQGKRDRKKALQREQLAKDLRLSSRTLKGFLNGNQKSLGQEPLFALFAKMPAFEQRYREATGRQQGPSVPRGGGAAGSKDVHGLHVQMTLELVGFGDQPRPITARLTRGREAVLTLKIDEGRVA